MRKLLSSLLFATVAGALVVGAAATLTVSSSNLGSGSTAVGSCDTDGINVAYTFIENEPQLVSGVSIEGIDANCDGQSITVVVSDIESAILAEATGTLSAEGVQDFALTFPDADADSILAADIAEVAVTITGGTAAVTPVEEAEAGPDADEVPAADAAEEA